MLILEFSRCEFDEIGALEDTGSGFRITKRPLTFNMNELMASANLPEEAFPSHTFRSAADYFEALALQHFSHLRFQERDVVSNEEDCRKKFTARCLFLNLTRRLFGGHSQGPFRLYCDDLRPSNVLVQLDDTTKVLGVSGVIDWEFTYAAPAEFTYAAPWWLLLQSPEDWEQDLNEFLARYMPRLRVFVEVLSDCEDKMRKQNLLAESQRLSPRMEQSMENGQFWVCMAARHSSMFDEIYWTFIDQRFYGAFSSLDDRMQLLDEEQKIEMEELVKLKSNHYSNDIEDFNDHYPIDKLLEL